ncbi:hypothetical protein HYS84_03330 [Candidatus Saccharibacteria bacterium]|nr:hypothetical protein [Candidatus Saccharibacteria bacterium]
MAQILFFGASVVYGVGGEVGGAPDIIKAELHKQAYAPSGPAEGVGHEIYNLGVSGATSAMLLKHAQNELSARAKSGRKLIVLLSVGVNDSKNTDGQGSHLVDIVTYKQNIEKILAVFSEAGASVIAYGFTPVDETKTSPFSGSTAAPAAYFVNNRIKEFEKVFMGVAAQNGAQTLPLFEQAIQESWVRFFIYSDGLHPNSAGHAWLAEKIKPILWKELQT